MWAAVIGSPIGHSLSPVLHRAAWASLGLGHEYRRIEVDAASLPAFLASVGPDCIGLSVTKPCKQAIIPLLDSVEELAGAVGAVNTVAFAGPVAAGLNTDVHGIVAAIREARTSRGLPDPRRAVILGSGATAASALAAMAELHADDVTVVARRLGGPRSIVAAAQRLQRGIRQVPWALAQLAERAMADADVLVSTVPAEATAGLAAGLHPRPDQTLLDVVYAPRRTPLVAAWESAGANVAPGWLMLLHQAVPQVQAMTSRTPDVAAMRAALERALRERA